ncbi:hypothetical protein GA0115233_109913, partial [Streptomyces sp. DI166]
DGRGAMPAPEQRPDAPAATTAPEQRPDAQTATTSQVGEYA